LAISPDGKFLAFRQADLEKRTELEEDATNRIKIGIVEIAGNLEKSKTIEIETSQSQFRWNEKGDAIYFINHTAENSAIWEQKVFENSAPQKIIELKGTRIYHFQFDANNNLVVSQGKHFDDAILIRNFD
jgi:dipeptidyl aminopeptidase/acylaminoacyl peptidase